MFEGGVTSFVRTDHIGRPVFATNTTGVKTWTASYTPFGGVRTMTGTPISARFPGQWLQAESGLHQNWMRDYDPTTGWYLQADPLGLVTGASVYGYANQSPMMYADPNGEHPVLWALAFGLAFAGWDLWGQLDENGWRWECVNPWQVAGAGIMGASLGPAAHAFTGSALGLTALGRGMSVNGLVGSSSNFRSYAYSAVSKRLRAANGLVGNSGIQLNHWAIAQGLRLGQFLDRSRFGQAIMNSRWNLNPVAGRINASIGVNVWRPANFWAGAPSWARFGPIGLGAGAGISQYDPDSCECEY
jgi:RHS repeat-associated protein